MRILLTSDIHGKISVYSNYVYEFIKNNIDLGIIAGDLTAYSNNQKEKEEEIRSILSKCKKKILFIMGNDDEYEWKTKGNMTNINQMNFKEKEYIFIGYQYTNPFIGGLFEKNESKQEEDYIGLKRITEEKYILITHGPKYGVLDVVHNGSHVGSHSLSKFIQETRPVYHFFGHIHESYGINGNEINASYPMPKTFYLIDLENNKIDTINA